MGSLLKPLLKKVTPLMGSRMLCLIIIMYIVQFLYLCPKNKKQKNHVQFLIGRWVLQNALSHNTMMFETSMNVHTKS
jgi:hypothetical protein